LEAILLASLLLLGGGYLTAQSADNEEPAVDLSFLDGDWDFNGLEAFVRPEHRKEVKREVKQQAKQKAKQKARQEAKN
jgi:hypothetical protein